MHVRPARPGIRDACLSIPSATSAPVPPMPLSLSTMLCAIWRVATRACTGSWRCASFGASALTKSLPLFLYLREPSNGVGLMREFGCAMSLDRPHTRVLGELLVTGERPEISISAPKSLTRNFHRHSGIKSSLHLLGQSLSPV